MKLDIKELSRYTTLPFLIDLVMRKKLVLLNPDSWEDYNDRKTIQVYKEKSNARSIYALCLTSKSETVHHWNAFSNGPSGCCIQFSYSKLINVLNDLKIDHREMTYLNIRDLRNLDDNKEILPYVKRSPFRLESEYRIIVKSNKEQVQTYEIPISLDIINRITMSNKLSKTAFNSLKKMLKNLEPQLEKKIYRSTLYENFKWIDHFSRI